MNQEETQVVPAQKPSTDVPVDVVDSEFARRVSIDTNQKETQVATIQEQVPDGIVEEAVKDIVPEPEYIVPKEDSLIVAEPEPVETTPFPDEQLEVSEINKLQQRQHAGKMLRSKTGSALSLPDPANAPTE